MGKEGKMTGDQQIEGKRSGDTFHISDVCLALGRSCQHRSAVKVIIYSQLSECGDIWKPSHSVLLHVKVTGHSDLGVSTQLVGLFLFVPTRVDRGLHGREMTGRGLPLRCRLVSGCRQSWLHWADSACRITNTHTLDQSPRLCGSYWLFSVPLVVCASQCKCGVPGGCPYTTGGHFPGCPG